MAKRRNRRVRHSDIRQGSAVNWCFVQAEFRHYDRCDYFAGVKCDCHSVARIFARTEFEYHSIICKPLYAQKTRTTRYVRGLHMLGNVRIDMKLIPTAMWVSSGLPHLAIVLILRRGTAGQVRSNSRAGYLCMERVET